VKAAVNTNQFVMIKVREAAEKKGLGMEMLFRAADTNSEGFVTLEDFKLFLKKIKLQISASQMARYWTG
jgi:hypothetical protein